MLTNEDLKLLGDLIEYLSQLRGSKAIYFCEELDKLYWKVVDYKKNMSDNANKYNKKNRKQHNLLNALYYHRKRGNQARVKEIEEKINELKNTTI